MGILDISGPIRLVIVSFYENDSAVGHFLETFHKSLTENDIIVVEQQFKDIGALLSFFRDCPSNYDYSVVMLVTHGAVGGGSPTYEETTEKPSPMDKLFENWNFVSMAARNSFSDRLVLLAVCYSGDSETIDQLTRGFAFALHAVTPKPGKPLEVEAGAKAMALFIDELVRMNKRMYAPEDLEYAMRKVDCQYPDTITLWLYGDTIEDHNDLL